ncbi:hypothetical protein C2S53_007439 [Perilla frutescens var. hirtella]|uniref:Uncharacterized protein n=1 Tax=Perilla frutescens var. hirtella TaxID=608512 RepID=A0AAD4JEX5_PERFH|nr:hypothetical protein C2S53_007439 [Perilla frutescens var. hirtella]
MIGSNLLVLDDVRHLRRQAAAVSGGVEFPEMHFEVEIQEEEHDRAVENGVEEPGFEAVAAAGDEVEQEHCAVAHQIAAQEDDLAVEDEREARARQPDRRPEPVAVDGGVDERRQQDSDHLKGLRELEPEERHEYGDGVAEQLEEGDLPVAEDGDERPDGVEEAGEVEGVRPEEDAAGGAGAEGEAEEPLEGGGVRSKMWRETDILR